MPTSNASVLDVLQEVSYDLLSGNFFWKKTKQGRQISKPCGTKTKCGYISITISPIGFLRVPAHRLAWFVSNGCWPKHQIDHINGVRDDNRIENLRDVPSFINSQNQRKASVTNRCGLLGVTSPSQKPHLYRARIKLNGKDISLGCFRTPQAAHQAYLEAKRLYHPGCTI